MDWDAAIEINRTALLRLLQVMLSVLEIEAGSSVPFVKRHARLAVLRLLRPAESALRRLILLKARLMRDALNDPLSDKAGPKPAAFPLFDQRKRHTEAPQKAAGGPGPRLFFFDGSDQPYTTAQDKPAPSPDDMVSAERLCKRLKLLLNALNDLEGQARRLKRAEARRARSERLKLQGPLRIHLPPGHRERGKTEDERTVDAVLRTCHQLARMWLARPDTS